MILKALYDYFHRSGDATPLGFETKDISFALVIDNDGNFCGIEDIRDEKGRGMPLIVPKGIRQGITPKPYLFWDNVEYILGYSTGEPVKAHEKHQALVKLYAEIADRYAGNAEMRAVCRFCAGDVMAMVSADPQWPEIMRNPKVNITFRVKGHETFVAECADLKDYVAASVQSAGNASTVCLITGARTNPVVTTTPTPIAGGKSMGRLVACQQKSGYDSYGKTQALNSPMSPEAEGAYTTALKRLLGKDSRNRVILGKDSMSRTFVFWAQSKSGKPVSKAEQYLSALFGGATVGLEADNPDAGVGQISDLFKTVWSGMYKSGSDDRFHMLGLAPNSARIAVVYWRECSVRELAGNILKHIGDMSIIGEERLVRPHMGIYPMLSAVTVDGKPEPDSPGLPVSLFKSITEGVAYPYPLFRACISRIRAGKEINTVRAAILKAFLLRIKYKNINFDRMLNKTITNSGYLCGRLFAVLELVQESASPGLNTTIRNRYISSASTSPASVFPTLLNLSFHHSEKLAVGKQVFYEKLKGEIIDLLPDASFPAHLDLNEQGCFMVGYYQQRQDLFRKKEDRESGDTADE